MFFDQMVLPYQAQAKQALGCNEARILKAFSTLSWQTQEASGS